MRKLFFIFLLLISGDIFAQAVYPAASFNNPRQTMNYFLKTMKGYKQGDKDAILLAIKAFDLESIDESIRVDSGKLAARRLINTLDRIERINVEKIPTSTKENKWIYRQETIEVDDKLYPVEISIGKTAKNAWKFTTQTLTSIAAYERYIIQKEVVEGVEELTDWRTRFKRSMPAWTAKKYLIIKNGQWIGIFIVILISLIFERIARLYVAGLTTKLLARYDVAFNLEKQKRFTLPIGVASFSGFWTLGIRLLEFDIVVLSALLRAGYIGFTVGCVITAHHLVDVFALYLDKLARESENKFDDILVPLVSKTLKFFVISIGIIFIGDSLTLDMKGIIAGMGIGGIAFALAAKDTVSNIFGSLTVLLDKPFRIGDWVLIDGKIEGTVEEVGLRSTRIRTFYDSLITVPNGTLTNAHIDNYGQRTYRRLSTTIGVQYDTPPELLESFCEGIRQLIKNHQFTRKDNFHVYFNSFGDSSLNILLYVFWKVPDWASELHEKHRLLMDILRLGDSMGIEFAFPTQTLHIYNENKEEHEVKTLEESMKTARELGIALSEKSLSAQKHRSNVNNLN